MEPGLPLGAPCVINPGHVEQERLAVVVAAGSSVLIVDVARDPRRHSRYRRPWPVTLEATCSELGVVETTLEEISVGGMRVRTPVLLPVDAHVFVSVMLPDEPPVLGLAEVRAGHADSDEDGFVARLQFIVMARSHYLRLATALAWGARERDGRAGCQQHKGMNFTR